MGIQRKTKFGFPPPTTAPSSTTVRLVPLTQGVRGDVPWTDSPPGSAISMTNFLPVHGALIPRSRLSSLNTIRASGVTIEGLALLSPNNAGSHEVWYSSATVHGLLTSNGSISRASFVSAFGLGTPQTNDAITWQYAQAYSASLDAAVLVAAGGVSTSTLQVLYKTSGGVPQYSYTTTTSSRSGPAPAPLRSTTTPESSGAPAVRQCRAGPRRGAGSRICSR
jgi:hypothetical protein